LKNFFFEGITVVLNKYEEKKVFLENKTRLLIKSKNNKAKQENKSEEASKEAIELAEKNSQELIKAPKKKKNKTNKTKNKKFHSKNNPCALIELPEKNNSSSPDNSNEKKNDSRNDQKLEEAHKDTEDHELQSALDHINNIYDEALIIIKNNKLSDDKKLLELNVKMRLLSEYIVEDVEARLFFKADEYKKNIQKKIKKLALTESNSTRSVSPFNLFNSRVVTNQKIPKPVEVDPFFATLNKYKYRDIQKVDTALLNNFKIIYNISPYTMLVGGANLDMLEGTPFVDLDYVMFGDESHEKLLIDHGFVKVADISGKKVAYIRQITGEIPIDITFMRTQYPKNEQDEFIKNIKDRDITVSSFAARLMPQVDSVRIYDITGKSFTDYEAKTLGLNNPTLDYFKEDPVRIIRVFYQAAKTGFTLSEDANKIFNDIKNIEYHSLLDQYSKHKRFYRKFPDLFKKLSLDKQINFFDLLEKYGLLYKLYPTEFVKTYQENKTTKWDQVNFTSKFINLYYAQQVENKQCYNHFTRR